MDNDNYENRYSVSMPEFRLSNYQEYPKEFDSYYNDHLPFRNNLIEAYSKLSYYIFNTPMNDKVIIGKDKWLFYNSRTDGDPMSCYLGYNTLSPDKLEDMGQNLEAANNYFQSKNIEFVVFIAPSKERIYPEYISDRYGVPTYPGRVDQVVNYIRENTDIRLVYPYDQLKEYRKTHSEVPLYYKTDTHWNSLGGYIGSYKLLDELGINIPDPNDQSLMILDSDYTPADLAGLLHLTGLLASTDGDYDISGFDTHDCAQENTGDIAKLAYHSVNSDKRKLFVQRDSFCSAMLYYVASQFDESVFVNWPFDMKTLEDADPDIVVLEVAERYLDNLIEFRLEE